jgi:hypothetical protein
MAIRELNTTETGSLNFEQLGAHLKEQTNQLVDGKDHIIVYPGEGTNTSNIIYKNGPTDIWVGIHNQSGSESLVIQAETESGDDFAKNGTFAANSANYLELAAGDIIYGRFKKVSILKTSGLLFKYYARLIIGV